MREITDKMREAYSRGGKIRMESLKASGTLSEFHQKAVANRRKNFEKYKEFLEKELKNDTKEGSL